jgi:uncharacterized protein
MEAINMSRLWHEPARHMLCLSLFFCAVSAWALEVPALTGRIIDPVHVLPPSTVESLTVRLKAHEETTSNQITVLVLPSLEGEPLESFSHRIATTWKLGQKGTDNGVLLLVAMTERKIRIEVGYGLEGVLTDARVGADHQTGNRPAISHGLPTRPLQGWTVMSWGRSWWQ